MSAGGTVADAIPQLYFCYQCNRTVTVSLSPTADLLCPSCNGGFLEEYENPNPNPYLNPHSTFSDLLGGLPLLFSSPSSSTADLQNPRSYSNLFGPSGTSTAQTRMYARPFDPALFLQNYIGSLRAGGANIQLVIENHPSDPGFGLPANIGDYFMGPGLEQLIQQLAENDPNRYGTPPASKTAVEALPNITVDDKLLSSDLAQCAVCKDDFECGMEVKQMPCKHVYHSDCILPWLELHSSCPVCRYELPTDDPDYVSRASATTVSGTSNASGSGSSSGGAGSSSVEPQGNLQVQRIVERTFSISLPWPLRGFGNNSGNSGGESNSGGQQNRDLN